MLPAIYKRRLTGIVLLCVAALALLGAQTRPLQLRGTTRAVVVGISEYQDKTIGDLRFAHRDAEAFAAYLQSPAGGSLTQDQYMLLTNGSATLGQVSAALEWLQESSKPGDRAIIYFSGHGDAVRGGSREGYMLCHDAMVFRYNVSGGLSLNWLQNVITTLSIEKDTEVLFFADACRSGGIEDRMGVRAFGQDLSRQYRNELKLLSCQPHEMSHEGEQWGGGRGVFSYYLIEGLMGLADEDGDESITLMELAQYVKRMVAMDMRPASQIPLARGDETRQVAVVDADCLASYRNPKHRGVTAFLPASPRTNTRTSILPDADSIINGALLAFQRTLDAKAFFKPEEDCVEKWFSFLEGKPEATPVINELRRSYAAALQDGAQEVLNSYLSVRPDEISKADHLIHAQYAEYPHYLDRACTLIGSNDFRYRSLKSRQWLFDGIVDYYALGSSRSEEFTEPVIDKWRKALMFEPENAVALFFLMDLYARKGSDRDSAAYYFQKVVQLDESWALPYAQWGYYLSIEFKDYPEAERVLKAGLAIDSTDRYLIRAMAGYYFSRNELDVALDYYSKAAATDSLDYIAFLNAGICLHKMNRLTEALAAYQRSLTIKPDQYLGYSLAGLLYHTLGDPDMAKTSYHTALQYQQRDIVLRGRLALIYLEESDREAFETQCEAIHQIEPTEYLPWYLRACYAAKEHEDEAALEYLRYALDKDKRVAGIIRCAGLLEKISSDERYKSLIAQYQN